MRAPQLLILSACIGTLLLLESCATTGPTQVPTLSFTQYGLEPGPSQNQTKSDIDIAIKTVRISDIYEYPDLFSFRLEDFVQFKGNVYFENNFPQGPLGKRWSYPFASPDASEQLLVSWVKIKNGTQHILRMKDARIYMIVEGQEPIAAVSRFDQLIALSEQFEQMERQQWDAKVSSMLLKIGDYSYPTGFTRIFISSRKSFYKLINDIDKEILPGFTYEGMLAFPVVPSAYGSAKISFFDVTTKSDAAGNPVEKTQFDFSLQPQKVEMWYDKTESKWKIGAPPLTQATQ